MNRKVFALLFGLLILFMLILSLNAIVFAASVEPTSVNHTLADGAEKGYVEHGVGIALLNNCGKDMFIPANSEAEWLSLNSSPPDCITRDYQFIDCTDTASGDTCSGSELANFGGFSYSNCVSNAEAGFVGGQDAGTCLYFNAFQDINCFLYDGSVSGSGGRSGTCIEYGS